MKLFKLAPIVAALAITAAPVAAEEVNGLTYNRIGIGYGSGSLDGSTSVNGINVGLSGDLSGLGFELQTVVAENVLLGFSYQKADGDIDLTALGQRESLDAESTGMAFTLGYRFAVADGTDIVPLLQYSDSEVKIEGETEDSTETVYGVQLNTRLSEMVQASLAFRTDGKDDEYGKTYEVGALFKVQQNMGIGVRYSLNDSDAGDTKTWTLTAEYLF